MTERENFQLNSQNSIELQNGAGVPMIEKEISFKN